MATEQQRTNDPAYRGEVATAVRVRQGVISGRVVLVLVVSIVLAVIALGACYYFTR